MDNVLLCIRYKINDEIHELFADSVCFNRDNLLLYTPVGSCFFDLKEIQLIDIRIIKKFVESNI